MDRFFKQLSALVNQEPDMKKAAENIKKDCRSKDQPNGNIKEPVLESICEICGAHNDDENDHLEEVVKNHRSIHKPGFYEPVSPPANELLRRVTSLHSFILYHILESFRGSNLAGIGYDKHSYVSMKKKQLKERLENGDDLLKPDELEGSTGKHGDPTWWTFYEAGLDSPGNGEMYMKELALSDHELEKAAIDNAVVESSIDSDSLANPLFKPTALDAFSPGTQFEPELSGKAYGYTSPPEPGLQSRPEIVSTSIPYRDLNKDTIVKLTKFTYNILQ